MSASAVSVTFHEPLSSMTDAPLRVLERGRVAERLNDRATAARSYQYVLDAWRHADPELRPYVDEARAGLARLSREPARAGE